MKVLAGEARGRFLAIEGLPGSGKTTLGEAMERSGWVFMREVSVSVLDGEGVPIGDRGNEDTDRKIFAEDWKRMEKVRALLGEGKDVVADGYFPTTLAFAAARFKAGQSRCYAELLETYREAVRAGRVIRPTMYVRLVVPITLAIERQNSRTESLNTINRSTLQEVEDNFIRVHDEVENGVPVLSLSGTEPPEANELKIIDALNGHKEP